MKGLLRAFQFLTILPIRTSSTVNEREIASSVVFFPVVGFFQGMLAFLTAIFLLRFFSADLASGLILLILILSNGGFHLDGLADTFDAIAVKSTGDPAFDIERRLTVMKDSAIGASGAIAITMDILLKYLLVKNLLEITLLPSLHLHLSTDKPSFTFISLLLTPVVAKWMMIVAMFHGRPARTEGLGRIFIGRVKARELFFSTLQVFSLYFVLWYLFRPLTLFFFVIFSLSSSGLLYLATCLWVMFCKEKFGGSTGDTLGALSEIGEILFLLTVMIWGKVFV